MTTTRRGDDANRERLLTAAMQSFAQRGFHGTTTRDIAAQAGMSPAAVYVHHKSKEDLLFQISRSGHERTLQLIQDAVRRHETPIGQLRALIHDFTQFHAEENTMARVVNYELSALNADHAHEIREIRRAISREVNDVVTRGVQDGSFSCPNPRMASMALMSLGVDVGRWYRPDGDWSPQAVADGYVELAMRVVGASRS